MIISIYASLLAIIFIVLSLNVVKGRRLYNAALGEAGGDLQQRVRAQGNFIEYTPFFLFMFLLAEMNGLSLIVLHILGVAFVMGRIIHAYGVTQQEVYENGKLVNGVSTFRVRGMQLTLSCLASLAVILGLQFIFVLLG